MTHLTPLGSRVIIKLDAAESTTSFGLVIPDTVQKKPDTGTVVSIGAGEALPSGVFVSTADRLGIREGDRVLLSGAYAGSAIDEAEGLIVVNADEILAVLA